MIRLIAFLMLLFLPNLLLAQTYPALHDVADVAANDQLNVRAAPTATADKRGVLAYDAINIEVTAVDDTGKWGQINLGEGAGWVSLRYLKRHDNNPDYALAQTLTCYGTEPFWSATFQQGQRVQFSLMDDNDETPGAGLILPASGMRNLWGMAFGNSVAIFRREQCSDGMSDRSFGLSATLFMTRQGTQAVYGGCCSIDQH